MQIIVNFNLVQLAEVSGIAMDILENQLSTHGFNALYLTPARDKESFATVLNQGSEVNLLQRIKAYFERYGFN